MNTKILESIAVAMSVCMFAFAEDASLEPAKNSYDIVSPATALPPK